MVVSVEKTMETIVETCEMVDPSHPLLQRAVLTRLFGYLSISELKISRRVCLAWREWATPYLQNLSIVRLKGTCDLCKSEWNVKKKLPHDHRETISLYRFVNQLHALTPGERERLFFRNFLLENINLYLIGRLNTDCTAYFLRLAKFFGSKVFQLHLQNVQLCPSDSLKTLMAMFRNVEVVTVDKVQVWQDPLFPSDESSRVLPPAANMLLTSLSFLGDCTFELPLDWQGILQQCPQLQEVQLEEVRISQVNNFVAALSLFTPKQLERLRVRKLTLVPQNDPLDELLENGVDEATTNDLSLSINKIQWASALTSILQSVPILELKLRLPYTDDSYDVIQALHGVNESLGSLSLRRSSFLSAGESEVFFKSRPWEITEEEWIQLPFVHTVEIDHNLVDSLDEIKHVFPGLEKLRVFIIPTEIRGGKGKPYSTYLHTNLILSMRNASAIKTVRNLEWNIQEARDDGSGKRTVIYRSRALRHIPRLFPNLVILRVSISDPNELQCIFRHLNTLEELTLLSNSLYRIKDDDLCGDEGKPTSSTTRSPKSRTKAGADAPGGQGIKQLKHLTRLSLENNNSHLTDRSIYEGLTTLKNLRSLHISNGKQLTFRGLRMLRKCRYLVYVNVTDVKDEGLRVTHMQEGNLEEREEYQDLPDPPQSKTSEQVDINFGYVSKIPTRITENKFGSRKQRRLMTSEDRESGRLPILVAQKPAKPLPGTEKKVEDFVLPPLTQYPTSNITAGGVNDDEHIEGLKELERLWKKRQERVIKKGGKYEKGDKFHKIGGRRYDYVRTTYKVNGRTYQLVRRTYEDDGEGDKICAKHRSWRERQRRKQLQADLDALSDDISSEHEDVGSDGDSESEYERSIKENDEDDDLEEYCDDDEDGVPVLSQSSGHSSDTDETFEEEGVCSDDSRYEADKEFYDSSPAEEESGDESENSEKEMSEASVDKGFVSESSIGGPTKPKTKKRIRFQEVEADQSFDDPEVDNSEEPEIQDVQVQSQVERFETSAEQVYKEYEALHFERSEQRKRMEKSVMQRYEALEIEHYGESELQPYDGSELEPYEESEIDRYEESKLERPPPSQLEHYEKSELERPPESELDHYEESELERPQESELEQYEESELERPQESELEQYEESELDHPQESEIERPPESELEHQEESDHKRYGVPELELYEPPELRRYEVPELQLFEAPELERYEAPELQRYEAPELQRYEAPELQRYDAPELQRYEASELDRYKSLELEGLDGQERQRYEIPAIKLYPELSRFKPHELQSSEASEPNYYGAAELQRNEEPEPSFYEESELDFPGGSNAGGLEESEYERTDDSKTLRFPGAQPDSFEDSPYESFDQSEVSKFKSPEIKRFEDPNVQVVEESRVQRFEKSQSGRYEETTYERFEKSKYDDCEESKYERREKTRFERFNGSSSHDRSTDSSFEGSSESQQRSSEGSQLEGMEESSLQRIPYHARIKLPHLVQGPYKYVQRRSAPIKTYRNLDFEPFSRQVHSQCESRRGSGSSCDSNGIYPQDWRHQPKPIPPELLRRYRFDESALPWQESSGTKGSRSNSSNSNDSINNVGNSNSSASNSNGSGSKRSNGSGGNHGSSNGSGGKRSSSNGSRSQRSNSNGSQRSSPGHSQYNEEMNKRKSQFSPNSEKLSKTNSNNDETDRESQHSQMSRNEKVSNDDETASIGKRGVQKSPPSDPTLPRIRKSSFGSDKESRPHSSSSRSSQRSSQRVSSMTGKARKKEQTVTMPCINPEDRHHLESSF